MLVNHCHLPVDTEKGGIRGAVGMDGVGLLGGNVVIVDGSWSLAHVPIGTAEHVVGAKAEVGGVPPVVVVTDEGTADGVGGEERIVPVHPLGLLQHGTHAVGPSAGGEQGKCDRQEI